MISNIPDTGYGNVFAEFVPFTATLRKSHGPRTVDHSVLDKFLSKLEQPAPDDPHACWKWAGLINKGMGLFTMGSVLIGAGRLAWILYHRCEVPDGANIRTSCTTPHCVHPLHQTAVPRKKIEYKPFAPTVKRGPGRPRKVRPVAAAPVVDAPGDEGFTIEELAPPELQRLARAQFGDKVPEYRSARRKFEWPKPIEIPAPVVTLLPTHREPKIPAPYTAPPMVPEAAPMILLDDIIALLSVPGTALITFPSKETTLVSPKGTYAGNDMLSLLLSAVTDAGIRKVAA